MLRFLAKSLCQRRSFRSEVDLVDSGETRISYFIRLTMILLEGKLKYRRQRANNAARIDVSSLSFGKIISINLKLRGSPEEIIDRTNEFGAKFSFNKVI